MAANSNYICRPCPEKMGSGANVLNGANVLSSDLHLFRYFLVVIENAGIFIFTEKLQEVISGFLGRKN